MTRVLVCGGRDFQQTMALSRTLDRLQAERGQFSVVMHGGAKGADFSAACWAEVRGIPTLKFPADWITYGKAAGPVRNERMLDEGRPDLVIAFPGGRGTADMVKRAKAAGVEVIEVCSPPRPVHGRRVMGYPTSRGVQPHG
jgi:hypothetical protein